MTADNPKKPGKTKKYLLYLLIVLILIDLVDQYSTNYINTFPSVVIAEFLSDYSVEEGTAIYAFCVGIATFGMYFVFVNQYLADKFGRKIMLAISSFGLGFSSLFLALSSNIIQFTIALFFVYVFFSSDMWLLYINEESPSEKRAMWTNIVLATGIIGPILIPIFRSIFITDTSANWRGMTIFPIILGIPLGIIVLLTIKETTTYEEIKEGRKKLPPIMLRENLKGLFTSPRKTELTMVLLMSLIVGLNYAFISLGENYISTSANLTQSQVNIIIYFIAFSVLGGYITTGILADKIGRKFMLYIHTLILPVAVFITVIGINTSSFALIILGFSLTYVGYWGVVICLRLISVEIVSTDKRGTSSGMRALVNAIGNTTGLFLAYALILFIGLAASFIILAIPMIILIPLNIKYIKETKGVVLSEIE